MGVNRIVSKIFQRYWRFSRGLTMGAQGLILTPANEVLLIRHSCKPGWHFPGGGVERNESAHDALLRELAEEAGVIPEGEPELFGLYANFGRFPGYHIALYVVRRWRQTAIPAPNAEIVEQALFPIDALPETMHVPARQRVAEVVKGVPRSKTW